MTPGDVVGDRFVIEALAATGGMGDVFRAQDRATGERVALKVLRAGAAGVEARQRFVREARLLARATHPATVRYVVDGTTASGELYLAMEWVEGETLANRLRSGPLKTRDAIALAACLADALGGIHRHGIIHRDLKPSNIVLVDGHVARAKLIDFGVARAHWVETDLTRTGYVIGTAAYMAPEQARGEGVVDGRVDIYALGVVLFTTLTGRAPFFGGTLVAMLAKVLLEPPPRLASLRPDVPPELDELVAMMLAKEPSARPATAADVLRELTSIEQAVPSSAPRPHAARASLGELERRILSLLLMSPSQLQRDDPDRTRVEIRTRPLDDVRAAMVTYGGVLEPLADGSLTCVFTGTVTTDLAVRAARCALALETLLGGVVALATGRAEAGGPLPVGEVVDRAARLLRASTESGVRLDDTTVGLLGVRFDTRLDEAGIVLVRERDDVGPSRTLLGKVTPFVGREREIAVLTALFDECVAEEEARAAIVIGPAGIGKSRLAHELLGRLGKRDGPVEAWIGRGDSVSAGSPFVMLGPPVARAAGVQKGEPLVVQQRKLAMRVAMRVPARDRARVTAFLGEMTGVPFPLEQTHELELARRDPMVMADHVRQAWQDFLRVEVDDRPVVIVLEDLHWGDVPSVALLDLALRNVADRAWLVVAFARPELDRTFPDLWRDRAPLTLSVGDLGRKASERLVRAVLDESTSPDEVDWLVRRSQGNAFFLEELVRVRASRRSLDMPETVLGMLEARLGALDGDARRVLRAASIFGQTFWTGAVAALVGEERDAVEAHLHALVLHEVVDRASASHVRAETEWTFRHANLRDTAYAMLTPGDRALGHELAGEWLDSVGAADAASIAEHFERGKKEERAQAMHLRAAREALDSNDLRAAVERAERGVRAGARGERLGALRLVQADASLWRGDAMRAVECASDALASFREGCTEWLRALSYAVHGSVRLGQNADAIALARQLAHAVLDPSAEAASHVITVVVQLGYLGEWALAESLLGRLDGGVHDVAARARLARFEAHRALVIDRNLISYLSHVERALALAEEAGDRRNACLDRNNAGFALTRLGAADVAIARLEESLAIAKQVGVDLAVASAQENLAAALALAGDYARARAMAEQAATEFARQKFVRMEAGARTYLASILIEEGNFERAAVEASLAVKLCASTTSIRAHPLALLARARLACGDVPSARRAIDEAMGDMSSLEGDEVLIELVRAEVCRAEGDVDQARQAIGSARTRLLALAQEIPEGDMRRAFLERIRDHARTLALAEELGDAT